MGKEKFFVNPTEMEKIASYLDQINKEFEGNAKTAAKKIISSSFYKEGKAKEVFSSYQDITNKSFEVTQHYNRAFQLVEMAKEEAMALDQALAAKIIGEQELT